MSDSVPDLNIQTSRTQLGAIDSAQLLYVLVEMMPPQERGSKKSLPLNIALVVDRSTSMKGNRMKQVKVAANLIIDKLASVDTVSIVAYSDRAEVISPSARLENKLAVQTKIRSILPSGGTEIYQGLKAAVRELSKVALDKHVNHLILLTDGRTYGDESDCLEIARQASARGIGFSAFGIGTDWNDAFLDELVGHSGGHSAFISEPEQVIHHLRQRIAGLGAIYAQNVRLQTAFPMEVTLKDTFKLSPFAQPLSLSGREVQLGSIEGRSPLTILLELSIAGQPSGRIVDVPLKFRLDLPSAEKENVLVQSQKSFAVVDAPQDRKMPDLLLRAVQILNMYRMNEQVLRDVEDGNVLEATKRMEFLTQRFREAGFTKLAQHALSETQRLSVTGKVSMEGRKQLKYGTRTLLTSTLNSTFKDAKREG